jgi:peptide/nickel transport system ATP-binding protein
MSILSVSNLRAYYYTKVYGTVATIQAVDGVSFKIEENEIYGIAGESGCGKTTLIKTIAGLIKPPLEIQEGNVIYNIKGDSFNLTSLKNEKQRKRIRRSHLSYIPQGSMSVLNPLHRIKKTFRNFIGAHKKISDKQEYEKLVKEHLNYLGLEFEVLKAYPHQLSGGMRQRVVLALATILKPIIIFADEPTTALDVVLQRGVVQLIKRIKQDQKSTIIFVTHDLSVHANLVDRLGVMYAGKLVEEGDVYEIFDNPLHPYTKYLMASLPSVGDKSYKISAPGAPPSLISPPPGCRFHPRCPKAIEICKKKVPTFTEVHKGHRVACFALKEDENI